MVAKMIKNGALGSDPRVGAGYEESGNNPRFVRAKRGRARSALFCRVKYNR